MTRNLSKFPETREITEEEWFMTKNGIDWKDRSEIAKKLMDKLESYVKRRHGRSACEYYREDMMKTTGVMLPIDLPIEDFIWWRRKIEEKWGG